jgi:ABC-2 type transport system permease protein
LLPTADTMPADWGYTYTVTRGSFRERLPYLLRILRVLARTDFKIKYAGSVLGYVWSVAKPLLYFVVLWVVFAKLFQASVDRYPLYLVIGIVLWTFVADGVSATLPSIVASGSVLRRISFPPIVIPLAATLTAAMTFLVNCVVVVVFIAASKVVPTPRWLLLVPLIAELYLYVLALALIASTLYVRFRDILHLWEVIVILLFFSTPIMYPVTILPTWIRPVIVFNPFVQILQDVRRIILGSDAHAIELIGHHGNHIVPLTVIAVLLSAAFLLYRRQSPRFAELA